MKLKRRYFPVEIRADEESTAPKIVGYAAVFDQLSVVLYGLFRERIERGAFAGSLAKDIRALWNHDTALPLARTKNSTLVLEEDAHGLRVEITPDMDTPHGRAAVSMIRRGDVDQMSFGWNIDIDDWEEDEKGQLIHILRKVELLEVSPVTFPAYPQTMVSARAQDALGDMPEIPERFRRVASGNDAERARARLAVMHRRLQLLDRHSARKSGG